MTRDLAFARGRASRPRRTATLDALPKDTHPMTQLSIGINALIQHDSIFVRNAIRPGLAKVDHWEAMFDDAMRSARDGCPALPPTFIGEPTRARR